MAFTSNYYYNNIDLDMEISAFIYTAVKYTKFLWRILSRLMFCVLLFVAGFYVHRTFFSNHRIPLIITATDELDSCNLQTHSNEPRCYPLLINFAHGCCRKEQQNNCLTGLKYGIRQCALYNKQFFDNYPDFKNRNKEILRRKRGAGYWLWKPFILFQELYLARDGDIIVYSDSLVDFIANISHLTKLTNEQDIIIFQLAGMKDSTWTKRDTFIIMNADRSEYTNTSASLASYLLIKKSPMSMAFVSEWLTYAQDSRVITDDDNVMNSPNYADFRAHRHDQSILSILATKWNLTMYPDPSQWGESSVRAYPTIFNHHRTRSFFSFLY